MKQAYFSKLFTLAAFLFLLNGTARAQCNCAWRFKMPITIANPAATTLTDYQVAVTVNTADLVSAGNMLASGDDIRFTDASCTNLPYWIESAMNTDTTRIWIKVNSIPSSGSGTINMYYGNPAAAAASSGSGTFIFFDDFNGSSVNPLMWNTATASSGTVTVSGGTVSFNTATTVSSAELTSINSYPGPYYSEMNVVSATGHWQDIAQANLGDFNTAGSGMTMDVTAGYMYFGNTSGNPYTTSLSHIEVLGASNGIWSYVRTSTGTTGTWPGGTYTTTSLAAPAGNQATGFGCVVSGVGTLVVDWIRGRKYASASTTQTLGAEELNSPPAITGTATVCTGSVMTLSDAATGTWSSSNTSLATVGAGTGVVNGVAAGAVTITFSLASGCVATITATINQTPAAITGASKVCVGSATTLSDATTGGDWSSSNTTNATVSSGSVTGVAAGVVNITYAIAGCNASVAITVNPLPNPVITVTGSTLSTTIGYSGYQWNVGGAVPIAGATDATYTFTMSAFYSVTVTDANGCTGTSAASTINVGIKDINVSEDNPGIYPNPFKNSITLCAAAPVNRVTVSNMMGQEMFSALYTTNTVTINLSQLPAGIYAIRINNREVYKVVKQP